MLEDPSLYWTKVAAIGQVAGAIATFLAAGIALWLSLSERRVNIRISAKFWTMHCANGIFIPMVAITVDNVGHRRAKILMFGWTTGYANHIRILPKIFRLRSMFQNPDYTWDINPSFPWTLEPGESKSTYMKRDLFLKEFEKSRGLDLFRKFPWKRRKHLFRPRVCVSVETFIKPIFGRVDAAVVAAIEQTYQG